MTEIDDKLLQQFFEPARQKQIEDNGFTERDAPFARQGKSIEAVELLDSFLPYHWPHIICGLSWLGAADCQLGIAGTHGVTKHQSHLVLHGVGHAGLLAYC